MRSRKLLIGAVVLLALWPLAPFGSDREGAYTLRPSQIDGIPIAEFEAQLPQITAAANRGDIAAIKMLEYYYGAYLHDRDEARKWVRAGANAGDVDFQYLLGSDLLSEPQAAAQSEGFEWLVKAARRGYPVAQSVLGRCYEEGRCEEGAFAMAVDLAEAVRWYREAALGGDTHAIAKLGEFYRLGKGVAKDLRQAHAWYAVLLGLVEPRSYSASVAHDAQAAILKEAKGAGLSEADFMAEAHAAAERIKAAMRPKAE